MMGFALVCTALYHRKLVEVYTPLFSRTVMEDTDEDRAGFPDTEMCIATGDETVDRVRQPVLDKTRPVIWIPNDAQGVSDEEPRNTRMVPGSIFAPRKGPPVPGNAAALAAWEP
jgi:hypothetical protein